MSKKTEFVKSIALTVLVIMSVVLFANSWVIEWSHSDSENENPLRRFLVWAGVESWFGFKGETLPGTDIVAPAAVYFTSGTKRIVVNKGTDMYSDTYEDILSVLLYVNDYVEQAEEIDADEWFYTQKNSSIYLDYGVALKREVLETGIGCKLPRSMKTVDSVVLTSNDSATNKLVAYFHDPESSKFYKVMTDKSAKGITSVLSGLKGYKNIPLAVELGFNATPEEGYGQQLIIYGNNIIQLEGVSETVPEFEKIENAHELLDNSRFSNLLSLFGISESSAKQYADVDGSAMFIDVDATLRFYNDENGAVLEYTSASGQKGYELTKNDSANDILYNVVYGAYTQVYSVKDIFGLDGMSIRISSDVTDTAFNEGNVDVYVDYCYNGIPIVFASDGVAVHGAHLQFNSEGRLIFFKQHLFNLKSSQSKQDYLPVMNAIDKSYALLEENEKTVYISDIYKSFVFKDGEVVPAWSIRLNNENKVYVVE